MAVLKLIPSYAFVKVYLWLYGVTVFYLQSFRAAEFDYR